MFFVRVTLVAVEIVTGDQEEDLETKEETLLVLEEQAIGCWTLTWVEEEGEEANTPMLLHLFKWVISHSKMATLTLVEVEVGEEVVVDTTDRIEMEVMVVEGEGVVIEIMEVMAEATGEEEEAAIMVVVDMEEEIVVDMVGEAKVVMVVISKEVGVTIEGAEEEEEDTETITEGVEASTGVAMAPEMEVEDTETIEAIEIIEDVEEVEGEVEVVTTRQASVGSCYSEEDSSVLLLINFYFMKIRKFL